MPSVTIRAPFRASAAALRTAARNFAGFITIWSDEKTPIVPSPAMPTPSATAAPVSRRSGSPTMFAAGISGSSRRVAATRSFEVTT